MDIARWDESQLVRRCKEGSEAAYAELVRRHRPRLFTLAYRLTSDADAAEDIVQETFVAAFRNLDRFEPRPSLAAWLNTIAIRLSSRMGSRRTERARPSLDAMVEAGDSFLAAGLASDPAAAAETAELRRTLTVAIAALPFKYRAAVVTRFVLGLDYAEGAASLGVNLNTFKSHLLRGTRMLRETLATVPDARARRRDVLEGRVDDVAHVGRRTALHPAPEATLYAEHRPGADPITAGTPSRAARFARVAKEKAIRG